MAAPRHGDVCRGLPHGRPEVEITSVTACANWCHHGREQPRTGAALAAHPASDLRRSQLVARRVLAGAHHDARWPMHTLTIKAIDRDGRPYAGLVGYASTSDAGKPNGGRHQLQGNRQDQRPGGDLHLLGAGFAP